MPLSRAKTIRLRIVMRFARLLGVPVDVHQEYFTGGKLNARRLAA